MVRVTPDWVITVYSLVHWFHFNSCLYVFPTVVVYPRYYGRRKDLGCDVINFYGCPKESLFFLRRTLRLGSTFKSTVTSRIGDWSSSRFIDQKKVSY